MFPAKVLQTAEFVELINNFFDSLNRWTTLRTREDIQLFAICKMIHLI